MLVAYAGLPARAEYTGFLTETGQEVAPELNAYAPPFELQNIDGTTLDLRALRGLPVLINFWATWCEPCKVEMPSLQAVYDAYKDRGLRIVAVNLGESREAVRVWVRQMSLTFDVVLDPTGEINALYQLRGQPSTYIVAPNGIISQIFFGPTTETTLETALAPYFSNGYTMEK
ncbi:MAG: TlpA disulfide reductase family protein [Chloroflexota bacterium]